MLAVATSEVIKDMTIAATRATAIESTSVLPNCGLKENEGDVKVNCEIVAGTDSQSPQRRIITLTASNGEKSSKVFTVYPAVSSNESEHVSESEDS